VARHEARHPTRAAAELDEPLSGAEIEELDHIAGVDEVPCGLARLVRERLRTEPLAPGLADALGVFDLGHAFDACLTYDALHHSQSPERVLASAHRALKSGGLLLVSEPNWKQRFQGRDATAEYGTTELGYSPRRLKRLLKDAGFTDITRFHNNRKRLFGNRPGDVLAHLAEPLTYRVLAPFWTQIWLRARAR
jgi:SAM-dependent methyltransferase